MPPKSNRKMRGKRRRWKHYKTGKARSKNSTSASSALGDEAEDVSDCRSGTESSSQPLAPVLTSTADTNLLDISSEIEIPENLPHVEDIIILDHDYLKRPCVDSEPASNQVPAQFSETLSITELLLQVHQKLSLCLPPFWVLFVEAKRINVMLLSRQNEKCVQRTLRCYANGDIELSVHCNPIPIDHYLKEAELQVPLTSSSVSAFCDRILQVVKNVRLFEVCGGVDKSEYCHVWNTCLHLGEVDNNPYQECRYTKTFRSLACSRLLDSKKWKCQECAKLIPSLRRSLQRAERGTPPDSVRNDYLTENQMLKKIKIQREKIESQQKKLNYWKKRMELLIAEDGVNIQEDLSKDLQDAFQSENLTPAQSMFLQQQVKASQKESKCGMRWHPSMVRIALAIFINSRSTYELIRDSGVLKLPSSRTLFDYSHPDIVKEGVSVSAVRDVSEKVQSFEESYKNYHVVMADEMYISKNLVFHKASGELRGYMNLNDFDKEVKVMENFLDDPNKVYEPEVSSKILTFLVKGVCTTVKAVIATFAVSNVSVSQMYMWTWSVIGSLERAGVRVVAFTCDGSPTNRALIKMHTLQLNDKFKIEDEELPGCAVYMTENTFAPERNLYFFCDVPHLLKTIRNCFNKSRMQRQKGKRRLKLSGEYIVWDTIINLYKFNKEKMLRKSYKLNPQNVYPDSYSCMKVSLAAQVMSETVASDIEEQHWPHTRETVRFIRFVNNWFDCLNGAHTFQGRRKKNPRLDPYTSVDDSRFKFLASFVKYLHEWKSQAELQSVGLGVTAMSANCTLVEDSFHNNETEQFVRMQDDDEIDVTPAAQTQLSHQTTLGIETTVKSFISCARFLLSEGCPFINARVFCQDPLEQHFSQLRSGFGGSTNPNASQCLNKQATIHMMGQLGVKRRGNTESAEGAFQVTEEPMRKRKSIYSMSLDS